MCLAIPGKIVEIYQEKGLRMGKLDFGCTVRKCCLEDIPMVVVGDYPLVHGPGCPVCVTPLEMIDKAHAIAARPGVIFCSFGDMLRVPGSRADLFRLKSRGADVRIVYSPLDCLRIAHANPDRRRTHGNTAFT